jgi:hypothetical protein
MSFFTGTQAELLYTLPAAVTKNTYTTIASITGVLGTNPVCAIPSGWLGNDNPNPVGRSLFLKVFGTIGVTATPTFIMSLGMNNTANAVATPTPFGLYTAATGGTAIINGTTWALEAWFTCTAFATSTATWQVNGNVVHNNTASAGALSSASFRQDFNTTFSAGVDPRSTTYVELFGTWSASSASNTTTVQQMFLWGLN